MSALRVRYRNYIYDVFPTGAVLFAPDRSSGAQEPVTELDSYLTFTGCTFMYTGLGGLALLSLVYEVACSGVATL